MTADLVLLPNQGAIFEYDSTSSRWRLVSTPGDEGGEPYNLTLWADAAAGPSETWTWLFNGTVTFVVGLTTSRAKSDVAATAQAVFSLRKNGVEFGTITFAAASTTGVFAAASETIFVDGDELDVVAPSVMDATLRGLKFLIAGTL